MHSWRASKVPVASFLLPLPCLTSGSVPYCFVWLTHPSPIAEDKGVAVHKRPFLAEFLEEMGKHFEPIVFTAANEVHSSTNMATLCYIA